MVLLGSRRGGQRNGFRQQQLQQDRHRAADGDARCQEELHELRRGGHHVVRQDYGAYAAHHGNSENKRGTIVEHGVLDHFDSVGDESHGHHGEYAVDDGRGKRGDDGHQFGAESQRHQYRTARYHGPAAGCLRDGDEPSIGRVPGHGGTTEARTHQASKSLSDGAPVDALVIKIGPGDGLDGEPGAGRIKHDEQVDHGHEQTCAQIELWQTEVEGLRQREPCGSGNGAEVGTSHRHSDQRADDEGNDNGTHMKQTAVPEPVLQDHAYQQHDECHGAAYCVDRQIAGDAEHAGDRGRHQSQSNDEDDDSSDERRDGPTYEFGEQFGCAKQYDDDGPGMRLPIMVGMPIVAPIMHNAPKGT